MVIAFSHLGVLIKHSDVTDVNHVTFLLRSFWDNFDMKVAHILNENRVSKHYQELQKL